jgi:hypothetical protein
MTNELNDRARVVPAGRRTGGRAAGPARRRRGSEGGDAGDRRDADRTGDDRATRPPGRGDDATGRGLDAPPEWSWEGFEAGATTRGSATDWGLPDWPARRSVTDAREDGGD